jgi:hypothetical protein
MRFLGWAALALPLLYASFAFAQQYVISTYAGGAPPPTPAPGTATGIESPLGVATDAAGNVYFASDDCALTCTRRTRINTPAQGHASHFSRVIS